MALDRNPQQKLHSVAGAANVIGTSERYVWDAVAAGEIKSIKLGRRRLIPDGELDALIRRKLAEAEAASK